jgi:hypothetical protein
MAALDPTLNDARPYLLGLLGILEDHPLAQMDNRLGLTAWTLAPSHPAAMLRLARMP